MNVNDIINIISSVGFPIMACIALGYYVMHELDGLKDNINDLTVSIKELATLIKEGKGGEVNEVLQCKNDSTSEDK